MDFNVLRRRFHGPTPPLPVFYRDDLSIDYEGMQRYVCWLIDGGIQSVCMTYFYSQMGFLTSEENLAITKAYAEAINRRAVFFASTLGETAAIEKSVVALCLAGADGVFVMQPVNMIAGWFVNRFVPWVDDICQSVKLPIMINAFPIPSDLTKPLISVDDLASLVTNNNFIGIKEDMNSAAYRTQIAKRYDNRVVQVGGGVMRNYIQFNHLPCQSEMDGMFSPRRATRIKSLLDERQLFEALHLIEESELAMMGFSASLPPLARNQAIFYAMGFASSPKLRSPAISVTKEQLRQIVDNVSRFPQCFEIAIDPARI